MVRPPCYDEHGIKKGAWSEDEDNKLRAYIERYGHSNWREVPKLAGLSRCGKSCRLRWMNYLRPSVKHGNFTKEEEDVITALHNKLGNKWSTMASRLPGRSDNEIKNHWHTHLKNRKVSRDQTVFKNERVIKLEAGDINPKGCLVKQPKNQQEVDILLAVLSSNDQLPSSSSASESCSLSVSDYAVPNENFTGKFSEPKGYLWNDILSDNDSILSSIDSMFSPLGFVDDLISQASFHDHMKDDVFLWSTLDL